MNNRKLSFSGSHKDVGQQVGELYRTWGRTSVVIPPSADMYYAEQLSTYEKYFPEYLQFLEGVALGLQVSKDDMIRSCVTAFLPMAFSNKEPHKCSVFAIKSGTKVFVGRNYDWREASEECSKLYSVDYTDKPECSFVALTDLATWKMGGKPNPADFWIYTDEAWNNHGLFMCLNGAPDEGHGLGLSSGHTIQLIIEKCKTTQEALDLLYSLPLDSSKIFTIADKHGDFAVVEYKVGQELYVRRSDSLIFATNHYNHAELLLDNEQLFENVPFHSTFGRYHYLETKLKKYNDSLNLDLIHNFMGKPPVLQNWRGKNNGDTLTIWILALDLTSGVFKVKFAPLTANNERYESLGLK